MSLSTTGCANLRSVFTSFGFPTAASTTASSTFPQCGCRFTVTATGGQKAEAMCGETNSTDAAVGDWTVSVIRIANPPAVLAQFPSVLITPGANQANPDGFGRLKELAFTNNALTGAALRGAEALPTWVNVLDISYNPNLQPFSSVSEAGTAPYYSFEFVTQEGNPNVCCPSSANPDIAIKCQPGQGVTCPNILFTGTLSSSTALAPTSTSPSNSQPSAESPSAPSPLYSDPVVPFIAPVNAPGTILMIALLSSVVFGALITGAVMWYSMKHQAPVTIALDDESPPDRK
ncbi:hypothetical protein HDU81_002302 [Chytriomyces hyalinus]|nr:hypothetical protein HDU81_002302 [Chytriomyces hyalinus]